MTTQIYLAATLICALPGVVAMEESRETSKKETSWIESSTEWPSITDMLTWLLATFVERVLRSAAKGTVHRHAITRPSATLEDGRLLCITRQNARCRYAAVIMGSVVCASKSHRS